ncbi:MAG: hypothetical protein KatS3mg010_0745 [Acidimicrobiia bacterium]|nr:MAG: hypothetical protein KatS3mg010_0745 [Acidimicrobiia bacterium]
MRGREPDPVPAVAAPTRVVTGAAVVGGAAPRVVVVVGPSGPAGGSSGVVTTGANGGRPSASTACAVDRRNWSRAASPIPSASAAASAAGS